MLRDLTGFLQMHVPCEYANKVMVKKSLYSSTPDAALRSEVVHLLPRDCRGLGGLL